MIDKQYDVMFDSASSGRPYMVYPKVFSDNRGTFSEVLVDEDLHNIRQVNRSTSCQLTVRGCHAQKAPKCQSKLVEALTAPIYDIITDARPDSKSFGLTNVYLLDPKLQNKLFVPRGFLHAFAVPKIESSNADAMFMYYCDNIYSKVDEICINPMSILPIVASTLSITKEDSLYGFVQMLQDKESLVLSKKDLEGMDYKTFMEEISKEYQQSKRLWYLAD